MKDILTTTEIIESHIRDLRKIFNYTTRSIPLEELQISGEVECSYDISKQSKIVERALLGFPPKPLIVIPRDDSTVLDYPILTLEKSYIVDGFCEVLSLANYLFNELILKDLKIMSSLNGTTFKLFDVRTRRRVLRSPINIMHLDWKGDMSVLKYFQS